MRRFLTLRKDYAQGICEHIENPGFFSTLTFSRSFWKPCPSGESKQYSEFASGVNPIRRTIGRLYVQLNDQCAGKPTRPKNRNLRIVMSVEGLKSRPHIHMITEDHPRLNKRTLERILLQASPTTSPRAIEVERIYDLQGLGRYVVKEIDPDELVIRIEIFGPLNKNGGSHA